MTPKESILKQLFSTLFVMFFFLASAQNPFIENKGQFPKTVLSKTNLPSGVLFIEQAKLIYAFYDGKQLANIHDGFVTSNIVNSHAYSVSFLNANTRIITKLEGESKFFENYYLGEKSTWVSEVKSYKKQVQQNIYDGIDLHFYVNEDKFKYELHLAKNSNEKAIKLRYDGASNLTIDNGNLLVKTSVNSTLEYKPYAYQIIDGVEVEVLCNYKLKRNILSFDFPGDYNRNFPLVIDPILEFSTYSGSTTDNFGYTATYDNFGFLYSGSTSFGVGYPTTIGAYQLNYANAAGGTDVAITKYDTSGTIRIYSTYLGGTKDELPHSMIVNSADELFIFGTTGSADFPTTLSAYQTTFKGGPFFAPSGIGVGFPNGSDIFVSRLSTNGGNLLASTFVGGTDNDGLNTASRLKFNYADEVRGEIDIDKNNNIYIATCTQSSDFPITTGFQNTNNGGQEGCIVKMDNQLTSIIWSSYLGGSADDGIYSLALDKNDNIYITGGTTSADFPITANAYQTVHQDSVRADAFISLINSEGTQLLSSSYYGSEQYDQSYFVEVGSTNAVYLFGQTKATGQTLVQNVSYSQAGAGQFVAVFNDNLSSVLRSTVVGTGKGTPDISPTAFLVDVCDKIYLSGWGSGTAGGPLSTLNLPVSSSAFQTATDGNDFYLMVLDDALSGMQYATYFGGSQSAEHVDGGTSRFDKKGIIYQSVCAGCGGNSDFPIEPNPGAVSPTNNSPNCNNGVFKFNFDFPMVIADFNADWVGCDTNVSFQNLSSSNSPITYQWDFGDATTSTLEHPTHNYNQAGNYTVTLIATAPGACNVSDTITKQVYILANSSDTIASIVKCEEDQIQIGLLPVNDPTITYFWFPSTNLSSANVSNPFCNSPSSISYQLLISNGSCTDTLLQQIVVPDFLLDAGEDTSYCNIPIKLFANYSGASNVLWSSNASFTDTLSLTDSLIVASVAMFYVKVSDSICEQVDSVEVQMESININLIGDLELCKGDSVFLKVNNLNPSVPLISYSWNPADVIYANDSASIFDYTDTSDWYSVEVVNTDGCIMKDSVFVNIYDNPILDAVWLDEDTIFRGETTYLNIETANNFTWLTLSSTANRIEISPIQEECYVAEVYNIHNCTIRDSICIEVLDVFCNEDSIVVPTAFSPNEDEVNDTYYIEDIAGIITDFRLEIFNRLGQKVFTTTDKFEKWDGTYLGKKLNPQVFDFYLELKCIGNKQLFKKGNITLIR
jgi:gliding motility-associated-like protein